MKRHAFVHVVPDTPSAMLGVSLDGEITFAANAARVLGYDDEELIGRSVQTVMPSSPAWPPADGPDAQVLVELPCRRKNGSEFMAELSLTSVQTRAGRQVCASLREAPERHRAEVTRNVLAFVAESSSDAIISATIDGVVTYWNPAAENLYGYRAEEMLGHRTDVLYRSGAAERVAIAERLAQGRALRLRSAPRVRNDGTTVWVDVTMAPIVDADGTVVGGASLATPAHHRPDARPDAVGHARFLEGLGHLAGGIAHDFNNLMGVIGGNAEFILHDAEDLADLVPEERRAAIVGEAKAIQESVRRAARLTRQLLAFGGRTVARPEPVSVNEVLRALRPRLQRTLGERIPVRLRLAAGLPRVMADTGQIEQIVADAAANARDAMPDGGSLSVDTADVTVDELYAEQRGARPGRYVRLRISDTGTGMSKAVLEHAFEPFFTTKPPGQATGLGLSTIYGIAARHDGHVAIYSEPDRGTTLSVLLPAIDASPAGSGPHPVAGRRTGDGRGRTILVVDDEAPLRDLAARILARDDHTVLVAPDGPAALELARTYPEPIDLLLTDVVMPGMLGKELAERFVAARPGVPVLYMSGYAQPVLTERGTLEEGMTLLEKPFTEAELRAAVLRCVRPGTG
jgi:PAS domain S-box-containing protein